MGNKEELEQKFHDLSKYVRREGLIIEELIEQYKKGKLDFNNIEVHDLCEAHNVISQNIIRLIQILKGDENEKNKQNL